MTDAMKAWGAAAWRRIVSFRRAMTSRRLLRRVQLPRLAGPRISSATLDLLGAERFSIGRKLAEERLAMYEPEVFALLCAYVEDATEPTHFHDIGANIGIFSLALRKLFGNAVVATAYEPFPSLARFIEASARRNELDVRVVECALSNRNGEAPFFISRRSDASSSLFADFRPHKAVINVKVRTLDSLCAGAAPARSLLKIDTEATEPDVLEGARQFISRNRPAIVCEVLAGRTERRLEAFFGSIGYLPVHLTGAPRWEGDGAIRGDATYEHRDWLFTPVPLSASARARFEAWYGAALGTS